MDTHAHHLNCLWILKDKVQILYLLGGEDKKLNGYDEAIHDVLYSYTAKMGCKLYALVSESQAL